MPTDTVTIKVTQPDIDALSLSKSDYIRKYDEYKSQVLQDKTELLIDDEKTSINQSKDEEAKFYYMKPHSEYNLYRHGSYSYSEAPIKYSYQQFEPGGTDPDKYIIFRTSEYKVGLEANYNRTNLIHYMNCVDVMQNSISRLLASGLTMGGGVGGLLTAYLTASGPFGVLVVAIIAIGGAIWYINDLRDFDDARNGADNAFPSIKLTSVIAESDY